MAGQDLFAEAPAETTGGRDLLAPEDPLRGYSVADVAKNVGAAGEQGVRNVSEDILDVVTMPFKGIERHNRGLEKWRESDGAFSGGLGYLGEIFDLTEPTGTGELTTQLANLGGPIERAIPEGEGPEWLKGLESAARVGTEMAVTAPAAGPKYFMKALKSAAGGATGAGLGQQYGGDTGELIGSLTGALSANPQDLWDAAKAVGGIAKLPLSWYRQWANRHNIDLTNATDDQLRQGVAEFTRQSYPGPEVEDTAKYLEELPDTISDAANRGELGTAGQLTGDRGLLNMEADVSKNMRLPGVDRQNARISTDIVETLDNVSTGDVAQAGALPRATAAAQQQTALDDAARLAGETEAGAQSALQQTMEAERNALRGTGQVGTTTETSSALAQTTGVLRDESQKVASDAWKAIGNPGIELGSINTGLKKYFGDMNPELAKVIKQGLGKGYKQLTNLETNPDFKTLQAIMSQLGKDSVKKMTPEAKNAMNDIKDILYDAMGVNLSGARGDAARVWREHLDKFGPSSTVGRALKGNEMGFGGRMAGPGDTGAGNTASLMNATGDRVGPELDNFLRAQFNNKYVDKTTGLIKPESVNQFKKQYGNQLSPELAAELEAAQKASQATQNVTGTVVPEAQTRAKLLRSEGESAAKAVEKTPAYRLGNVGTDPADVAAEFGKVMRPGKDRIKNLKSLIASTDGDPKALEDLRAAAMESFTTKLYDQDTGVFRGKVAADRLNQNKNVYLESGLFDKEHIANMERAVEQGKKLNMHKNSAGLKRLPAETQRVLEGMAALVGAKGGALAFGSPLIGAAIGRKAMVKFVSSITTEQSKKLAYEMATNPEQFKPILERLKASNMNAEAVNLAMKAIINTVARTGVAVDERDE